MNDIIVEIQPPEEIISNITINGFDIDVEITVPEPIVFEISEPFIPATNGKDGKDGVDGYTPIKGIDYFDGVNGVNGYTPIKGVDYFDGVNGTNGSNGSNGLNGYTPIKGVDYFDGVKGDKGNDGYTPIKGVDYFDGVDGQDGTTTTAIQASITFANESNYEEITVTDINIKATSKIICSFVADEEVIIQSIICTVKSVSDGSCVISAGTPYGATGTYIINLMVI